MEEKLEIFFVRHADAASGSTDGRDKCDRDITELGITQCGLLAERFRGARFDAVLSSPLVRCVRTAASVANVLENHVPIEIVPELIERGSTPGYGGQPVEYLKRYYDDIVLCRDNIFGNEGADFPNDLKSDAMERARALVAYLKERYTYGQRIIMFSHACFGNSFLPSAISIREEDFRMTLYNTSVSKIKYTPDGVERMSFQNDTSHLLSIFPDFQYTI